MLIKFSIRYKSSFTLPNSSLLFRNRLQTFKARAFFPGKISVKPNLFFALAFSSITLMERIYLLARSPITSIVRHIIRESAARACIRRRDTLIDAVPLVCQSIALDTGDGAGSGQRRGLGCARAFWCISNETIEDFEGYGCRGPCVSTTSDGKDAIGCEGSGAQGEQGCEGCELHFGKDF